MLHFNLALKKDTFWKKTSSSLNSCPCGKPSTSHGDRPTVRVEDKSYVMSYVIKQERQKELNYFSPVLILDPGGKELPQFHGEAVTVQMVQLLQIPGLQLLQLVPLSHPDIHLHKPTQKINKIT